MTTGTKESKAHRSATELDRATERYALKLLQGDINSEDEAEFERLMAARKRRLVKLGPVRKMGLRRGFRTAS